jgi:metabotropic X receptor
MRLLLILLAILAASAGCEARRRRSNRYFQEPEVARRWRPFNPETNHPIRHGEWLHIRALASGQPRDGLGSFWPVKLEAVVEGDLVLGGLMMVHEREDFHTCGPVMPQGGVQALEAMLYTLDKLNDAKIIPGVKIGAHILDDCDKDTYGLEMAVDFIKGESPSPLYFIITTIDMTL